MADNSFNTTLKLSAFDYYVKIGEKLKTDPDKEERLLAQICPVDFYMPTGGGRAVTKYSCEDCIKIDQHDSTAVPTYCKTCATKDDKCRYCGASMGAFYK